MRAPGTEPPPRTHGLCLAGNGIERSLPYRRRRGLALLRLELLLKLGKLLEGNLLFGVKDLVDALDFFNLWVSGNVSPMSVPALAGGWGRGGSHSASTCPRCHS